MNIDIQFEESNQTIDLNFGEIQIVGGSENITVIEPLTVTENGTYTAQGDVDGYSPVYVNVEEAKEEQEKTIDITENGTTEVTPDDGKVLSKVTVNVDVEKGITPSGTIEITENGEYDVTEYASANVNVESTTEEFVGFKLSGFAGGYGLPTVCDARSIPFSDYYATTTGNASNLTSSLFGNLNTNANGGFWVLLKTVYLPTILKSFGNSMFAYCSNLKNIYGDLSNIISIDTYALRNCKSLTEMPYLPKLLVLGNGALVNCTGLTKFNFYATATSIHTGAFNGCTNLKDIYVPWSEGEVANAPWGATKATIHYNTTYDENHNPIV